MRLRKIGFFILSFVTVFLSCNNDDDGDDTVTIELNDRGEQQILDSDSLEVYLTSHYYNSGVFQSNSDRGISDIIITELEEGETVPTEHTLLKTAVGAPKTVVNEGLTYEYYVLRLNEGEGINSPNFTDNLRINYEGFTLDDAVFDSQGLANPEGTFLDLTGTIFGWKQVIPTFNIAKGFNENGDGTFDFVNSGLGVMFLPSGLAYFPSSSSSSNSTFWYSPLIFKFELLQMVENDHDGDGIPSYLEDLNGGISFTVNFEDLTDETDDDTDGDGNPNYFDTDDDGDGILTTDEIVVTTENKMTVEELRMISLDANQVLLNEITEEANGTFTGTIITFTDTDADGIYDYLDAE